MKTLTEFFGRNLKSLEEQMATIQSGAQTAAEEALKAEGKTEEEIQAALPEAIKGVVAAKITELTKMEGDKISWALSALEMVKGKRGSIKRVLVMSAGEGEKIPAGLKEIDGKYFSVEFFPEAGRPGASMAPSRGERGGRDGKGRGGKGGKGGRDGKGRGDDRRPRRPEGAPAEGGGSGFVIKTSGVGPTGEIGGRPARPPRGEPRGERKPRREATPRAPLTEEQKAEMAAKRAERDAARAAKNAEFLAKREAAAAAEPQYDGKTNRIKPRPAGSAPLTTAPVEQPASEESSNQQA
jgi:hypothetical protein